MNDSESDPYESGQNSERSDISDDNDSHQETELHDNSDVISLEAESDGERFDPTEGENSFSLDGSMAAYCQKYFYQHLTEDSIKRNILDAAPVPANAFCTPPKVDDFVEDFIDFNAMKFLKMQDKSLTFIQKKIAQIMGPLAKIWQAVDGARKGQEENSEFTVLDMLKLVEQTVVLVGQANATCLYERRVNFLAKIMKGVKKAKEHLKTNEHDLSREKDVLYGETVFKALDRKSKSRKRAREISKEMQSKKRRIDQTSQPPFRAGPSRGYGNRGGRQSTWMSKQGSQSNRKPVQSNYKIPKKPRSGENRYENYQWYSSCYGTNNKNIKSEQPTCLSDTSQVQRNLSRQNTPRGKIRSISRKLGNDNKRSKLIGEYFRLQNRIQFRTNSEISTKTNKIIRTRNANSKFRNRGDVGQTGSGGCSDKNKLSVCQSFICTPQKRWGNETNIQSENSKPICSIQSLQNGGVSGSKKLDTEKGLVMQSRSKGCILLHTNMQKSQKISKVSVQRTDATVQRTAIWTGIRSETFHKNNETSHCAIKTHRSPPCDLLRRHIVAKSITRRALKRQRHTLMVASQSRLVNKLEKISSNPMSATRISGSNNKFSGNGDNSIGNQSREYQKKMYRHDQQNRSVNTRVIKFNRNTECYSRSCHPSLTVCEGASNVSNKMPAKIKKKLSTNDNTPTNFQRGDKLVATAAGTLEWKTNSTVLKPGLGNRNRCLENRVGGSMSHSELKNGGALEPLREKIAYQCTGTESSTVCNSITDQTQTEHSCSHQIRQHNSCCISEQNGGDQIRTVITNNKADLDSLSIQKDHDYCRTYTRNTECSSRLGESSDEGYQQLDAEQGNIQTNKSDVGAIKNRSLCRQVEHTTGKLHELASRPICNGNGCIPDTLEQQKRVCFPSILPNNKMFVQSSERKVRNCHNNSSMADSTILSTTSDLVNRQPNSFTSHEKPATVTRGSSASTSQQSNLKASGLEGFRRQKQAAGVSEQTSELLAAGWRQGTQTAYNSCWRQWDSWCQSKQIDPFQTSVEYVADFLAELYAKGYEYRTINSYRSAISAFHAGIEGNKIGKHDLICQLMTGIFNKNPPRPRYMQMWDVNKVLSYIIGMENNKDLSLKEISMKLCMLMALASASRSSEIHKFDIENMNITEDEIIFTLKSLTKSRRVGQSPISVKFTKYEEHPKLDIISCTMEYLEKTKIIRAEEKQLFVSFIKPHKAVKSCTIASWLKNLLALSGIDVSVFKPHSTRGASTSKANKYGLSIEQIINKGNWKSCKTFKKFYNRPIVDDDNKFQEIVLKL